MPITEAERQVLIALIELCEPITTPNNTHYAFYPKTLSQAATYFGPLGEDWTPAYPSLLEREWITPEGSHYALTEEGKAAARQERLDHPPIWYWYRQYYTLTADSKVYSRFCEGLYGRDLCQTNFSDMAQIDFLVRAAALRKGQKALDLGCGRGLFAEYLSDCTNAQVWGTDYIPEAIEQAQSRTKPKRERLDFKVGNFDHLDYPNGFFDLIISIDTLYMPNDLPATLRKLQAMLAPGGRMLIFYSAFCLEPSQPRDTLLPDGTALAQSLQAVGLKYRTWDFTESQFDLMRRKNYLAKEMRSAFEAEGSIFLYNHVIAESDGGKEPFDPEKVKITRYLYEVNPSTWGFMF